MTDARPVDPVPQGAPTRTDAEAAAILSDQLDRLAPRKEALGEEGALSVAAWTLMHAYEFEAAELAWRRAAELDDRNVEAVFHVGLCLLELGRFDRAAASFRAAMVLDEQLRDEPDTATLDWLEEDPAYRLGCALHAQGDLDAAIEAYEMSVSRNTIGVEALREIARCHLATQRPDRALGAIDRIGQRAARLSVRAEMIALRAEAEQALLEMGG